MKKLIFTAFLLLNVVVVWPAQAETGTDEIPAVLQTLRSDCFEKYQKQFFNDKASLSYLLNTPIDLSQLGDISTQTGLTQEYQPEASNNTLRPKLTLLCMVKPQHPSEPLRS